MQGIRKRDHTLKTLRVAYFKIWDIILKCYNTICRFFLHISMFKNFKIGKCGKM